MILTILLESKSCSFYLVIYEELLLNGCLEIFEFCDDVIPDRRKDPVRSEDIFEYTEDAPGSARFSDY